MESGQAKSEDACRREWNSSPTIEGILDARTQALKSVRCPE
jgi:hypothetical protein